MKKITIGDLRQRLALERPIRTSDGGGGADENWSLVATVWAAMKPLTGTERLEAESQAGTVSHEIWMRHRDNVTPEMRFRLGTRLFDVRSVMDVDEKGQFLRCLAEERDL